jgi:hypothetical protein
VVYHHQQTLTGDVIGNIAPPAAATTTVSTAVTDKEAALSSQLLGRAFGPFRYQGPQPATHQDMFAPRTFATSNNIQLLSFQQPLAAAGDPFTGTAGGAAIGAEGATHAGGDYDNTASTLMQSLQIGGAAQDENDEVAGVMASNTAADPHLMTVPQQVDDVAAMFNSNNNSVESFMAPHQAPGMAYRVNNPAMAGGAFDGNAAAFMAPQVPAT